MLLQLKGNSWSVVEQEIASLSNSAFVQGLGLIETMRISNRMLPLAGLHLRRLQKGVQLFNWPQINMLHWNDLLLKCIEQIETETNSILRLQFFTDVHSSLMYVWVTYPQLHEVNEAVNIGLNNKFIKGTTMLSELKHSSRADYTLAMQEAKQHNWFDTLIANPDGNWIESTICNVFWLKDGIIFTPPIADGCVAGVMRTYLLHQAAQLGINIQFASLTTQELFTANEVFLTNAVKGIIPVSQVVQQKYNTAIGNLLHVKVKEQLLG